MKPCRPFPLYRLTWTLTTLLMCHAALASADEALVAHYPLREGDGVVAGDASSGKRPGTIVGAGWLVEDGEPVLRFNGKSDYVDCGKGSRLNLRDKMTVSAWIYPKGDPSAEAVICGESPGAWAITHYKGRVYFYIAGGGNFCYTAVPFHQWSHVVGTFDGRTSRLYVNGAALHSRDLPGIAKIPTGNTFVIGGGWSNGHFNGLIRDVRVHARALSETEVAALAAESMSTGTKLIISQKDRVAATRFFKTHVGPVAFRNPGRQQWLANRKLGIEFLKEDRTFYLTRLYDIASGQDFLAGASATSRAALWKLTLRRDKGRDRNEISLASTAPAEVSTRLESSNATRTLVLKWAGINVADEPNAIDVQVSITLKEGDPLSRWRIHVANRSSQYGLWDVTFPILRLRPIEGNHSENYLTVPYRRGLLVKDPFVRLREGRGQYPLPRAKHAVPSVVQFIGNGSLPCPPRR